MWILEALGIKDIKEIASKDLQNQKTQWKSPNINGNLHPNTFKIMKKSQWQPPNLNGNLHPTTSKIQKESMDISKSQCKFASKYLRNPYKQDIKNINLYNHKILHKTVPSPIRAIILVAFMNPRSTLQRSMKKRKKVKPLKEIIYIYITK